MLLNGYIPQEQWEKMTPLARVCMTNEAARNVNRMNFDRKIPVAGHRFGRLVVIARRGVAGVVVECDCGMVKTVSFKSLRSGSVQSCGCLRVETGKKHGPDNLRKHWAKKKAARAA